MEVIKRKLEKIIQYLEDLKVYQDCSFEVFMKNHYKIERLIELLVAAGIDILLHILSQQVNSTPISYRDSFLVGSEKGIISKELGENLAKAVGMRNILVHEYESIDYKIVHKSIEVAIKDFTQFLIEINRYLDERYE